MQLILRHQSVRHFANAEQTIATVRFDIDANRSVGGRLIRQNEDWNWYLSYRMSGKEGLEYFLIVGDPNANQFQRSLVFKVVAPLTIGR